jgi:DNA processing protein
MMAQACVSGWRDWLRLQLTPGVGSHTGLQLWRRMGTATAVFDQAASRGEEGHGFLSRTQAQALSQIPSDWKGVCERVDAWLGASRPGESHALWTLDHPQYPQALRETHDPPLCLFVRGQVSAWPAQAVAVVGSRNPTRQGLENAQRFAASLAENGWCVVSGLALGIDGAAHQGALSTRVRCATVAVVGTGLDQVYPASHHGLAEDIASQGMLVSELLPGAAPLAAHFPRRNRLIAALSQASLVVEASLRSGSLITARLALDLGRDVLAVPGSIHSPQSRGCHALIKQGAKLVESIQDVFDELTPSIGSSSIKVQTRVPQRNWGPTQPPPEQHRAVWQALGHDPVSLELLCQRIQQQTAQVLASLLALELGGWIERLPGGRFQRVR